MKQKTQPLDWVLLMLLVAIWGASFAMSKAALKVFDASWVMALRLSVAALVLVPVAYAAGHSLSAPPRNWAKFVWLGFIGNSFPFFVITWGMHFIGSGVAGLLMGTIPLFVVVFAHFALPGERLTPPKAAGFVLGFIGIIVLMGPKAIIGLSFTGDELLGEAAVIFGCLCYGIHGVTAKLLGVDAPLKQSSAVCLAGAVMGTVFARLLEPGGLNGATPGGVAAVVGLGVLPTAAATILSYRLMARTGPSFVSYSNYLVPVVAVALGALLLNESVGWNVALALLLILAGIAVSRIDPNRWKART